MDALSVLRPSITTVRDWDKHTTQSEVLGWAEDAAQWVDVLIVIPKIQKTVHLIPHTIGGKPVVLGYPTGASGGRDRVDRREYEHRPVHLLGGSPQAQLHIRRTSGLNVISADCNMIGERARANQFWQWGATGYPTKNRFFPQLAECDGAGVDYGRPSWQEALERSARAYSVAWHRGERVLYHQSNQLKLWQGA
jgi:hypothetical protein